MCLGLPLLLVGTLELDRRMRVRIFSSVKPTVDVRAYACAAANQVCAQIRHVLVCAARSYYDWTERVRSLYHAPAEIIMASVLLSISHVCTIFSIMGIGHVALSVARADRNRHITCGF